MNHSLFIYDTYVKGERYAPNGEKLPLDDSFDIKMSILDDVLSKWSKREYEMALISTFEQKQYSSALLLIKVYKEYYPDEQERLERCRIGLGLCSDFEDSGILDFYTVEDEGMRKLDFDADELFV